jgi:hypothetical protein
MPHDNPSDIIPVNDPMPLDVHEAALPIDLHEPPLVFNNPPSSDRSDVPVGHSQRRVS